MAWCPIYIFLFNLVHLCSHSHSKNVWQKIAFSNDVVLLASSSQVLQLCSGLGWFTADCKVVGMNIGTSQYEIIVPCQKRMECHLQLIDTILTQVEKFKYFVVLFVSDVKVEHEFNRQISTESAERTPLWPAVAKKELRWKAKLSIDLLISCRFLLPPMVKSCGSWRKEQYPAYKMTKWVYSAGCPGSPFEIG